MRFIHTADWQIGMRAVHAGEAGKTVRAARLATAERVCRLAASQSAEFILLAGDTFEDNAVDRDLVERVARMLDAAGCPVYILPGNHDPLVPGSVWEHAVWRSTPNVTILTQPAPVPGGRLIPCPLRARRSQDDPTAWIEKLSNTEGIQVVVAHGTVGDLGVDEGGYPISLDVAARTGADYVALGHWHSTVQYSSRMAYSGTHEPTRFGERDSGNVLVVSIAAPGSEPVTQKHRTAELEWLQIALGEQITTRGRFAEIARDLALRAGADKTLVEIAPKGLLFESDQDELDRIDKAARRFVHARIDWTGLQPAPSDDDWIDHLPAGVGRIAATELRAAAVGKGQNADVAMQALLELYTLSGEVRQ
jgi:DNA repair exonuclease SbcCD nuclease subunit